MKGIVCAGGTGSRMGLLTKVTNKHLLPVYDRPMICYPIQTLKDAGITDIMIISGKGHAGAFLELLGGDYTYRVQEKPDGIAGALKCAKDWIDEPVAVILGDNIFFRSFRKEVKEFKHGCMVFVKEVDHPERFGVYTPSIDRFVEKPSNPETNMALTGFYLFDKTLFGRLDNLQKSSRGEYEITDLINSYMCNEKDLKIGYVAEDWIDAGTPESLYKATRMVLSRMTDLIYCDPVKVEGIVDSAMKLSRDLLEE